MRGGMGTRRCESLDGSLARRHSENRVGGHGGRSNERWDGRGGVDVYKRRRFTGDSSNTAAVLVRCLSRIRRVPITGNTVVLALDTVPRVVMTNGDRYWFRRNRSTINEGIIIIIVRQLARSAACTRIRRKIHRRRSRTGRVCVQFNRCVNRRGVASERTRSRRP